MSDFRERAAIMAFGNNAQTLGMADQAIQCAQKLADAACEAWGHRWSIMDPKASCYRCGIKKEVK
jgi:hypothetical protein